MWRPDDAEPRGTRTLFAMLVNQPRRFGAVIGPVVVGVFLLASCGAADDAATQSTIDLSADSTAFIVRPPATTIAPEGDTDVVDGVVTTAQDYVVQSGDYPYKLVEQFGITLEDLVAYNEWGSEKEFPGPGTTIKIPPGGKAATAASTDTGAAAGDAAGGASTTAAPIPDAGDNCAPGSYTIVEGDYLGKVAKKFDVTVDALNAANSGTSGYGAFYVGLEIVIPAKADC